MWTAKQFGAVLDRFRSECSPDAWDDLLFRYAFLIEKGPLCGPLIAKKLKNGKGIWELLAHADNIQPRALFYFSRNEIRLIVFVHAFIKKGNHDYLSAIRLAQQRRSLIERGEKTVNVIQLAQPPGVH